MFTTAISYVDPTFRRQIFIHIVDSITIMRATEIEDGKIYGVYWAILCNWSLSSMVMGGRCKDRFTKTNYKGIIEAVINCPVVVIQC